MRKQSSRLFLIIGLLLIVLGIASLFIAIPQQKESGFSLGPVDVDVSREVREPIDPMVSAVIIGAGVVGVIVGLRK